MTQRLSCAPIANNRPWRVAVGRSSDDPNVFSHVQNRARIQDVEDVELPLHPEPADAELLRKANVDLIPSAQVLRRKQFLRQWRGFESCGI